MTEKKKKITLVLGSPSQGLGVITETHDYKGDPENVIVLYSHTKRGERDDRHILSLLTCRQ